MQDDDVAAIEEASLQQWANFGRGPGGRICEENGLVWVEAPVPQLPYNAVLQTKVASQIDERVDEVIGGFRDRRVEFMWLAHPTAEPADLTTRLKRRGLSVIEDATGMSLETSSWRPSPPPRPGIEYSEVVDEAGMRAYEELITAYWELSEESSKYVFGINRWGDDQGLGTRWVAYKDGHPVGKIYLSRLGLPDTAAIFGVYVGPEARGYGVATHLTALAVERAAEEGRRRVVLHSSAMAHRLYERMGFETRCDFPAYGTKPLHSLQPS